MITMKNYTCTYKSMIWAKSGFVDTFAGALQSRVLKIGPAAMSGEGANASAAGAKPV